LAPGVTTWEACRSSTTEIQDLLMQPSWQNKKTEAAR